MAFLIHLNPGSQNFFLLWRSQLIADTLWLAEPDREELGVVHSCQLVRDVSKVKQ